MNAKLNLIGDQWLLAERIERKPVVRPDFTPTTGMSLAMWVTANADALHQYEIDLKQAHGADDCTFPEYCAVEFDLQELADEERAEWDRQDHLAEEADSKYDGRDL